MNLYVNTYNKNTHERPVANDSTRKLGELKRLGKNACVSNWKFNWILTWKLCVRVRTFIFTWTLHYDTASVKGECASTSSLSARTKTYRVEVKVEDHPAAMVYFFQATISQSWFKKQLLLGKVLTSGTQMTVLAAPCAWHSTWKWLWSRWRRLESA